MTFVLLYNMYFVLSCSSRYLFCTINSSYVCVEGIRKPKGIPSYLIAETYYQVGVDAAVDYTKQILYYLYCNVLT